MQYKLNLVANECLKTWRIVCHTNMNVEKMIKGKFYCNNNNNNLLNTFKLNAHIHIMLIKYSLYIHF